MEYYLSTARNRKIRLVFSGFIGIAIRKSYNSKKHKIVSLVLFCYDICYFSVLRYTLVLQRHFGTFSKNRVNTCGLSLKYIIIDIILDRTGLIVLSFYAFVSGLNGV